jgi:hypothetical protein
MALNSLDFRISDLEETYIVAPVNGHVLTFNASDCLWKNLPLTGGGEGGGGGTISLDLLMLRVPPTRDKSLTSKPKNKISVRKTNQMVTLVQTAWARWT